MNSLVSRLSQNAVQRANLRRPRVGDFKNSAAGAVFLRKEKRLCELIVGTSIDETKSRSSIGPRWCEQGDFVRPVMYVKIDSCYICLLYTSPSPRDS